jgi:hypothetical protein
VVISNITAGGARWPCALAGIAGHPVEGVTLRDFRIAYKGGGTQEQGRAKVPEYVAKYPTADMFESYPAYGLYCRHARDLQLSGIHLRCESPDLRPAVLCEDVARVGIDALEASAGAEPVLEFRSVQGALVRGCAPTAGTKVFLNVTGTGSGAISLLANDFSGVGRVATFAEGALPESVRETGNRK